MTLIGMVGLALVIGISSASATVPDAAPPEPMASTHDEGAPMASPPCEPPPARLLAEVVAIDARSGIATLATPRGRLELKMTPATLAQLDIGDQLVVELVDEPPMRDAEDPICI